MIYKKKKSFLLLLSVLFICLVFFTAIETQAQTENKFNFGRDLTLGSTGLDVMELQVFLNRDSETRLAVSGAGSPGQETQYFGPITKNALIRFQDKYASEVLTPLGLSRGTGYFGPSTRAKISSILKDESNLSEQVEQKENSEEEQVDQKKEQSSSQKETESSSKSTNLSLGEGMYTDELMLNKPSRYTGQKGEKLSLFGFGFTDSNTVYFGDSVVLRNVKAKSHDSIVIDVPESLDLGYHEIQVENEKGRTTDSQVFFVVTDGNSVEPKIESVSPQEVSFGDEITVYGEGFDEEWNMIRASFAIVEGIVSDDGKSLTFKVESFYEEIDPNNLDFSFETNEETRQMLEGIDLESFENEVTARGEEVYFYVVNDGGVSKNPGKFLLKH